MANQVEEYIQVVTTTETRTDAQRIAIAVVEKRLAGCAQVLGPITSTYWWKEKVETAEEWLCVVKSRTDLYGELEKAIRGIHPYEVPEILAIPVVKGSKSYLEWLDSEINPRKATPRRVT
jgi:periplasmic divalent cation tolerance protein